MIGAGSLGRHTGLALHQTVGVDAIAGYLALPWDAVNSHLPAPILGASSQLERILREIPIREVYLAATPFHDLSVAEELQRIVGVCEQFGIPFALPASGLRLGRARPAHPEAIPDGYLHYLTIESHPVQMAIKRCVDFVASFVALLLLSPLLLVVAALIKLTSRGPVFFPQERVGQFGRPFKMLKFRSMVVNAEALKAALAAQNEQTGPVFKMQHDPRVTKVGRFIRKFSIDELPQLFNVLRGQMSIVGPRPPIPSEVAHYQAWQRRRLSVPPGLTCIWQVSGRNQISFEDWMYLDMQYIDNWSLKEDLRLIAKTVPVVVTGRGAS